MQQADSIAQGQPAEQTGLPLYYREGFFSGNPMYHPELPDNRSGIEGTPKPYSIGTDNILTMILMVSILAVAIILPRVWEFLVRQSRTVIYRPPVGTTEVRETKREKWMLFVFGLVANLAIALACYFYCLHFIGTTFLLPSNYLLIAVFFGWAVVYFLGKMLVSSWVNPVFFGKKKSGQWMKSAIFLQLVEGVLVLSIVLLWTRFGLSLQASITGIIIVVVLIKMMSFGQCLNIFFNRKVVNLHFFLYFCTLEMIPLLVFWGGVVFIGNYLKINF